MSDEEFVSELAKLAKLWEIHHGKGLELRLQTGQLLNRRLGTPDQRQVRGEGVLKTTAVQLKTTEGEISRMRHFALYFKSTADLKEKHPDVDTWTAVKELLPTLNSKRKKRETVSDDGGDSPASVEWKLPEIIRVDDFLTDLKTKLVESLPGLEERQLLGLFKKFQELADLLADQLDARAADYDETVEEPDDLVEEEDAEEASIRLPE